MYSAIKDIVIAAIFWITLGTGSFVTLPKIYKEVQALTQERFSKGLSPTVKFTEALVESKKSKEK